uniref:Uncharacterized protein n=1 Tax=Opuntia streptacantha TaxID=393608 RepID=A0A7C9AK97_OPUST
MFMAQISFARGRSAIVCNESLQNNKISPAKNIVITNPTYLNMENPEPTLICHLVPQTTEVQKKMKLECTSHMRIEMQIILPYKIPRVHLLYFQNISNTSQY